MELSTDIKAKIKRAFDVAGSAVGLVALAPIFAVTAVAGAAHFGKSPFLLVDRVGRNGESFRMLKLRSMTDDRDEQGALLPDMDRRTPYGKFLRATSIDELPQLVNILKGDMSFVGPRPRGTDLSGDDLVPDDYRFILDVRPGLTGPWQVFAIGRKEKTTVHERLELDAEYARHPVSIASDAKLMVRSLASFVKGHDGSYINYSKLSVRDNTDANPYDVKTTVKIRDVVLNNERVADGAMNMLTLTPNDEPEPQA